MSAKTKYFRCDRCGITNPDYLTFGVGRDRNYCLNHIPWHVRIKMWWRERRELSASKKARQP